MVEKRTFVFVILATIVWASLASAFAGYYYTQNVNTTGQLSQAQDSLQNSLQKVTSNYNVSVQKYDQILSEYSLIYGDNYSQLMPILGNLIKDLGENYTAMFNQEDLNESYTDLLSSYNNLNPGNVTSTDFGNVVTEFYNLFNLCAWKDLGLSISNATSLTVNLLFDYGNGTMVWHNETKVLPGYSLFQATGETAAINYTYWPSGPGHIEVDSINNKASSGGYYWIWYYWDNGQKTWVEGPVGCDAWMLENGGVYKWSYEIPTY